MTMVPRMFSWLNALRIASTAAWSASFSSPRPITRAEAIAAASVSRTASSPMFLSMRVSLRCLGPERLQEPVGSARRPQPGADADVHGVPESEDRLVRLAPHLVLEADLDPRVRLREVDLEHVVVQRRLEILHRRLVDREQDAAALDLAVRQPEPADEVPARALEEAQVVRVVDDAHLVGAAVDHADAVGPHPPRLSLADAIRDQLEARLFLLSTLRVQ